MNRNNKVLCAMSGGIDSSVSAFLLKQQGYDVTGITMDLNVEASQNNGLNALEDAKRVCDFLKIPHKTVDFSDVLERKVIQPFIQCYESGNTPNPCVQCNKYLKFGDLLKKALSWGFDFLATGHYAKKEKQNGAFLLKVPKDRRKDQTYFLYQISASSLPHILFPLEDLDKQEVKKIAKQIGLPASDRPESHDICFIPDRNLHFFLENKVKAFPGPIKFLSGEVAGQHKGIPYYTIGQRSGLGIQHKTPLYIIKIVPEENTLVVAERAFLQSRTLTASQVNLFVESLPEYACAKIRYAHVPRNCSVSLNNHKLQVVFEEPQEAITPGQSVVIYQDDFVLGGGVIEVSDNLHSWCQEAKV